VAANIKVSVMYPNTPGARFDHAYYRDKHTKGSPSGVTSAQGQARNLSPGSREDAHLLVL
jgi:hypothetical protein